MARAVGPRLTRCPTLALAPGGLVAEVEGEDLLGELARLYERPKRRRHAIDGDVVPAHAADAVKVADGVRRAEALGVVHLL